MSEITLTRNMSVTIFFLGGCAKPLSVREMLKQKIPMKRSSLFAVMDDLIDLGVVTMTKSTNGRGQEVFKYSLNSEGDKYIPLLKHLYGGSS